MHGKRFRSIVDDKSKNDGPLPLDKALGFVKSHSSAKFDETVEIAIRLGVNPKHTDQMVRGTVVLPNGTGKKVKVLVLAKGEKVAEAEAAGADWVGADEYVDKIKDGWLEFDRVISTPDMMGSVGKLGRILGPRGLMPNPKTGTVTFDVGKAVEEVKGGKIQFKVDRGGNLHAAAGKASFDEQKLVENARAFLSEVQRLRPSSAKGQYIKSVTVSSTMGAGVRVDLSDI